MAEGAQQLSISSGPNFQGTIRTGGNENVVLRAPGNIEDRAGMTAELEGGIRFAWSERIDDGGGIGAGDGDRGSSAVEGGAGDEIGEICEAMLNCFVLPREKQGRAGFAGSSASDEEKGVVCGESDGRNAREFAGNALEDFVG